MTHLALLREALATTWANKVPSALVCLIVAAMCIMTISTVGRTAAAEAQVAERINSAGARELVLSDKRGADLIGSSLISMASRLSVTDRAVGIKSPVDVHNTVIGAGGDPIPAWPIVGDIETVAVLDSGRLPGPGEALISGTALKKLGLQQPIGSASLADSTVPIDYTIVGSFTAREPFTDLAHGLIFGAPSGSSATHLHIVLKDAAQAASAQRAVIGLFGELPDPESISVRSPLQLAQLHDEIVGDLGSFGRTLLYGALGIGALLVGIVVFADILVRRKDLGRRRALGATRANIILLMLLRTLIPAIIGGVLGMGVGMGLAARAGSLPPLDFCLGIVVLALVVAGASALVPATYAAHSDPVKVLRTP
ncbi:permease [Arthrobacter sp. MYb227]|uniref:ABC transporter permease n=1 Tax=Arthrobacter sp. MYb227 TaxID=1848601 RepID=UPI000CFDD6F7|nr:FtsX-like permease family protein [Arthrobacter sp. MYb227]PQZ93680.1 permease [Arthrobacter sp. MYb227]